jgi:hypothetical protein
MGNKLTFKDIDLASTPKKLLNVEAKTTPNTKQGRKKSTKPVTERVQVYIEQPIVEALKAEWEQTGIKGFSNFLVWKMQKKGVFETQ